MHVYSGAHVLAFDFLQPAGPRAPRRVASGESLDDTVCRRPKFGGEDASSPCPAGDLLRFVSVLACT